MAARAIRMPCGRSLRTKEQECLNAAKIARWNFGNETLGAILTDAGVAQRSKLDRAIEESESDLRQAKDCESNAILECNQAKKQLQNWIDNERIRLLEAPREEDVGAEKPLGLPLSEELKRLRAKLKSTVTG